MLPLQVNIALAALRVALSQEYLCVDHGLAASRTWESEASLRGERALVLSLGAQHQQPHARHRRLNRRTIAGTGAA